MSKRLVQLISRFIGAVLLALAGAFGLEDSGQLVANTQAVGAGVAALIAFLVDLWLHRSSTGSVFKSASKVLVLGACLVAVSGCTMSDSQRYRMLSTSYQGTANVTASLIRSGEITNKNDLEDIRDINNEIKTELDAMDKALRNDVPFDFHFLKRRVESLLGRLIQYQLDAERVDDDDGASTGIEPTAFRGWHESSTACEAGTGRVARLDARRVATSQAA